jgi:hypothetical protein
VGGDRSKNIVHKLVEQVWTTPELQAPKKDLELLDERGEAVSGSDGTPLTSYCWRPELETRPLHMEFIVGKAALLQVFLHIFLFSPINIIP